MSNKENPSLSTLPVEIVHKIFSYLDTITIVRSIRCVCKNLYSIVNSYDKYEFNFNSILKNDFLFLCNYIQHKNVISLTLSDNDQTPGQIQYFLSLFRLKQFTQLRYLTLIEIDDCYLNIILKDIKTNYLYSLKIHSQRDYTENITNINNFLSIISLSTLKIFDLNISSLNLTNFIWPIECTIEHLEINCSEINDYFNIVHYLPNLKIFVIRELNQTINDGIISKPNYLESFKKLNRLTLEYCHIDMFILQLILSLTPTIKYLQLMKSMDINEFTSNLSQLENFIKINLIFLNKFQFFFLHIQNFVFNTSFDIESIVNHFRNTFWIENKKWFIICDYIISSKTLLLYTPLYFDSKFIYHYYSKEILRSTTISNINHQTIIMDSVENISISLEHVMPLITSIQGGLPMNRIFPNINNLRLYIGNQWPIGSLRFLSNLIDLSKITKLTLEINNSFNLYLYSKNNIEKLFQLMNNINSLTIFINSEYHFIYDYHIQICSLIPSNIKYLSFPISTINQMKMIIDQLKSQSSIQFQYINTEYDTSEMHIQYLDKLNQSHIYRLNNSSLSLWIKNSIN